MATTASGFWYPDEGTNYNINTIMATMASSMENKIGPQIADTGWIDCPVLSPVKQQGSMNPTVRRIGKVAYLRWGVSGSGLSANTAYSAATVPNGFRPTEYKYFQVAGQSAERSGRLNVRSDGILILSTGSSVSSYYIFDTAWWMVD